MVNTLTAFQSVIRWGLGTHHILRYTGENNLVLADKMQSDMDSIGRWCLQNAIMMNVKKTKTMMFGTRQKLCDSLPLSLYADGRPLECVPTYKYLGTFVDSELNFVRQSNETIKSISYKLYYLGKIKCFLTTNALIQLYKSYIQPYFDYNDIFLETTTSKQYDKLNRLQLRCLRRCLPENIKVDKEDIHNITGINKIKDRADAHILKLMYKRTQFDGYRDLTEGRTRLHDGPVLNIPFPNNETFKKSIIFRGSTLWNSLTPIERNTPSFECFKSLLKQKLKDKVT